MAANRLKSRDQCDDSMTTDTLTEMAGKTGDACVSRKS